MTIAILAYTKSLTNVRMSMMQKNIDMMNQWLILKHMGASLEIGLKERNISIIAIYGMGIYGRHLVRELENTDVAVSYGIDAKVRGQYKNVPIHKLGHYNTTVDAVIITVSYDEQNIIKNLKQYYNCPIISLNELVYASYPTENTNKEG